MFSCQKDILCSVCVSERISFYSSRHIFLFVSWALRPSDIAEWMELQFSTLLKVAFIQVCWTVWHTQCAEQWLKDRTGASDRFPKFLGLEPPSLPGNTQRVPPFYSLVPSQVTCLLFSSHRWHQWCLLYQHFFLCALIPFQVISKQKFRWQKRRWEMHRSFTLFSLFAQMANALHSF